MDTIKRVYDLAEEKEISLYQLAKDSGISLAVRRITGRLH